MPSRIPSATILATISEPREHLSDENGTLDLDDHVLMLRFFYSIELMIRTDAIPLPLVSDSSQRSTVESPEAKHPAGVVQC